MPEKRPKLSTSSSTQHSLFSEGKVYTDEEIKTKCTTADGGGFHPPMPEILITMPGIERLLRNLNPAKAAGPDGITLRGPEGTGSASGVGTTADQNLPAFSAHRVSSIRLERSNGHTSI